jgi:NADPH:quinone reductase-like Zn-dependent oxidoreductase
LDSSGLQVLTTASPKNFDLVKSRGADVVFDYHDTECAAKIRAYTNNSLRYILDCISTPESFKICADAFPSSSEEELKLVALLPLETWPRRDVNAQVILAYTTFGEAFTKFGTDFPAIPQHFEFGEMFWKLNAELLGEGKIQPHPVTLRSGGLHGIPAG